MNAPFFAFLLFFFFLFVFYCFLFVSCFSIDFVTYCHSKLGSVFKEDICTKNPLDNGHIREGIVIDVDQLFGLPLSDGFLMRIESFRAELLSMAFIAGQFQVPLEVGLACYYVMANRTGNVLDYIFEIDTSFVHKIHLQIFSLAQGLHNLKQIFKSLLHGNLLS